MVDKKKYIELYLKEYFINNINVGIWKKMKKYSIYDNIIIKTLYDDKLIRYIVSSLILQHRDRVDYTSVQLFRILDLQFDKEDDYKYTFSDFINPRVLIIKEFGDPNNKLIGSFLNYIISERNMRGKNTIVIFTTKSIEDYFSNNLLTTCSFKVISIGKNVKNKIFVRSESADLDKKDIY